MHVCSLLNAQYTPGGLEKQWAIVDGRREFPYNEESGEGFDEMQEYFEVECPSCGEAIRLAEIQDGQRIDCRKCGGQFTYRIDDGGYAVVCPHCGAELVADALAQPGDVLECADCGERFELILDGLWEIECPHCGAVMDAGDEVEAGMTFTCKACGQAFVLELE